MQHGDPGTASRNIAADGLCKQILAAPLSVWWCCCLIRLVDITAIRVLGGQLIRRQTLITMPCCVQYQRLCMEASYSLLLVLRFMLHALCQCVKNTALKIPCDLVTNDIRVCAS